MKYLKQLKYIDWQNIVMCAVTCAVLAHYFTVRWLWALLFIPLYVGLVTRLSYLLEQLKAINED